MTHFNTVMNTLINSHLTNFSDEMMVTLIQAIKDEQVSRTVQDEARVLAELNKINVSIIGDCRVGVKTTNTDFSSLKQGMNYIAYTPSTNLFRAQFRIGKTIHRGSDYFTCPLEAGKDADKLMKLENKVGLYGSNFA